MKEIICITCPKGCHLKVDEESFAVTGNSCPRGAVYGANELRNPVRVVTSTVVVDGPTRRLPETSPDKGRGTGEAGGGVSCRRARYRKQGIRPTLPLLRVPAGRSSSPYQGRFFLSPVDW